MRSVFGRAKPLDLDRRLAALRTAVELGEGRLPEEDVDAARAVTKHAGERLNLGAELTVVALAGATGSGKSSLFNDLAGTPLSEVGVRRPTTDVAHAALWGERDADTLLDWLRVPHRHRVDDAALDGLVLLDLPDHDSTQVEHRIEVNRLVELVDMFVWVVDPQKYADAALHEGYLRPMADHAAVTLVVLNHADRLDEAARRQVLGDLKRLVGSDGLSDARVLVTSARTGDGLAELRSVLAERVSARRAAAERLAADVAGAAARLQAYCSADGRKRTIDKRHRDGLVVAFAAAAGVDNVADAVAASHRRRASLATGWPFTRWLRRFRPDPLARLHLGSDSTGGRTSLRPPSAIERAQVESAIRVTATGVSEGLPHPWPTVIRERAGAETEELLDDLDRAVAATDLGVDRPPRWWTAASWLQTLIAAAAVVGFLWLTVLFVLEWFQIPRPPTPEVRDVPWPTIVLFGGLLAGFVLAVLFGFVARVSAARRRRRAYVALRERVNDVAHARVIGPVEEELEVQRSLCAALAEALR